MAERPGGESVRVHRDQLPLVSGDITFPGWDLTPERLPPGWEFDRRGRVQAGHRAWLLAVALSSPDAWQPDGTEPRGSGDEGKQRPLGWQAWTAVGTMVAGDVTFSSGQMTAPGAGLFWEVIVLLVVNETSGAATTWSLGEGASGNPAAGTPDYSGGVILGQAGAGLPTLLPPRALWFRTATANLAVRFRAVRATATDVVRLTGIARKVA